MLKTVLESVDEMLCMALKVNMDVVQARVYIDCAEKLLKKTISSMEVPSVKGPEVEPLYALEAKEGKLYRIADEKGRELGEEAMVELNGEAMPYKEARGKAFQTGRVL